ncbi:hypothetical protein KFL_015570020, partial [Klebsormidium nitens]
MRRRSPDLISNAKPFLLDTDYSKLGIGATLSQLNEEGRECPVAFASRALHGAEANYSVTDGELLAMVWAITDKFRSYLFGGPTFTVRVDHNPLVWLHQQTGLTGRLARWHCKLLEFNFTVVYRPGRLHSNVDPLSRNPVATLPWEQDEDPDELPSYAAPDFEYPPSLPQVSLCVVARDVDFSEGMEYSPCTPDADSHMDLTQEDRGSPVKMTWETVNDGASDWEDKSGEESASEREEVTFQPRKLFEEEEELLIMEEEITFQDWAAPEGLTILTILAGETTALEPPERMQGLPEIPARARIVLEEEEMVEQLTRDLDRHLGLDAQQILEAATRKGEAELPEPDGFDAHVQQVLTRRRNFLRNGGVNTPLAESTLVERVAITILQLPECGPRGERTNGRKLTSTEVDLPLEKVGFDLLGPFPPTTEGYEYVYIWYDYFSGWIGAGLGKTKQSAEVAEFLKMDLFAAHACPALIIMDNDAHVGEVKDLCQRMGTQVQVIAPYSPWMNGGAESSVKIFTKNVRKLVIQYGPDCVSHIYEA